MSRYRAILKVRAFEAGVAQPLREQRHFYVATRPFVLAFVQMAAEPFSLWACLYGRDPDEPSWMFAVDPRDRDQQNEVFQTLAADLTSEVERCDDDDLEPLQLWVSNVGAAANLARLGRVMRLRSTSDEMRLAGSYLDLYAQAAAAPGSSLCIPATRVLGEQKVTGQSDLEDANLAAQLVWWDTGHLAGLVDGLSRRAARALPVFEAARRAEKLPMGTLTDPQVDESALAPLLEKFRDARRKRQSTDPIEQALGDCLFSQVDRIWKAIWAAHAELARLREAPGAARRWHEDAKSFQWQRQFLLGGGRRRFIDSPTRAQQLMSRWERAQADAIRDVISSDRLALVEAILDNAAVAGNVKSSTTVKVGRSSHPLLTIESEPTELTPDTEVWLSENLKVKGVIEAIERRRSTDLVTVHVTEGMRNNPMPAVGDFAAFITHAPGFGKQPALPRDLPWTHQGPAPQLDDDDE